jgi:hypothetical protein
MGQLQKAALGTTRWTRPSGERREFDGIINSTGRAAARQSHDCSTRQAIYLTADGCVCPNTPTASPGPIVSRTRRDVTTLFNPRAIGPWSSLSGPFGDMNPSPSFESTGSAGPRLLLALHVNQEHIPPSGSTSSPRLVGNGGAGYGPPILERNTPVQSIIESRGREYDLVCLPLTNANWRAVSFHFGRTKWQMDRVTDEQHRDGKVTA